MAKPSKRMAARQAELSRRKRQHRPAGTVVESEAPETTERAASPEASSAVAAPAPSPQPPARPATGVFRQPSFRSATRAGGAATTAQPSGSATPATGAHRALPQNAYQGRDLRTIAVITTVMLVALIGLRIVL